MGELSITDLRESMRGRVLLPGDNGYDQARGLFNGMIDRRPAVIAQCRGPGDVRAALNLAVSRNLPVAVRGGGHNVAGHACCDDGVMIDLSLMRSVRVDPRERIAWADPGCTWTDFDQELWAHRMATTGGTVGSTGIAGLTLGGGIGWLMGTYGLTCDNLVAADLVTADGRLIHADDDSEPEVMWGLRGGGGNFGVVTSFVYRIHPIEHLTGGIVRYPIERAREALELYREVTDDPPDQLTCTFVLLNFPEGGPTAVIVACWNGPEAPGEKVIASIREFGPPTEDLIRPVTYLEMQKTLAEIPFGLRHYWKGHFIQEFSDDLVEASVEAFLSAPSPLSKILIEAPRGQASRIPNDATAHGQRHARYNTTAMAIWEDATDDDANIAWARDYARAAEPAATGDYINYLGHDSNPEQIAVAYGGTYQRLVRLKTAYDPHNVFRLNQNIKPESVTA
jgi:FAD/FMN-containing dehydrogenase